MDISNVQKINQLAREFLDKGVTRSMEEAAEMAENLLTKNSRERAQIRETRQYGWNQGLQEDLSLQLRKVNVQINEHAKTILALRDQLQAMRTELDQLKREGKRHLQMAEKPVERETATKEAEEEVSIQETAPEESVGKKLHAKVGGYNPQDVAIEKIFYCGPKDK